MCPLIISGEFSYIWRVFSLNRDHLQWSDLSLHDFLYMDCCCKDLCIAYRSLQFYIELCAIMHRKHSIGIDYIYCMWFENKYQIFRIQLIFVTKISGCYRPNPNYSPSYWQNLVWFRRSCHFYSSHMFDQQRPFIITIVGKITLFWNRRDGFWYFYQLLIKMSISQQHEFDKKINCFWSKYQIWKLWKLQNIFWEKY